MTKDEALKQWVDDVSKVYDILAFGHTERAVEILAKTRNAMREALAQPQQESVAEIVSDANGFLSTRWADDWIPNEGDKLYTSPPQRKPLTDEQIETIWRRVQANDFHDCVQPFSRAIEAAHGIKE